MPITEVGQQLRAAFVLEGSVRRADSRRRITARLAETRTGHSVWAERYDRQLEDVFAIQDEIAQNIARALRVVLSDQEKWEIEKVPTRDVQAYDYYLGSTQPPLAETERSEETSGDKTALQQRSPRPWVSLQDLGERPGPCKYYVSLNAGFLSQQWPQSNCRTA